MRMRFLPLALLLVSSAALADDEVTHDFATATPRDHVRRVVVDVPAGEVKIRNGASDRIAVSARPSATSTDTGAGRRNNPSPTTSPPRL
jgi:hypothetical protein